MTPKNNKEYNPLRPWSNYLQPGLLEQVDEVIGTKKLFKRIMDAKSASIKQEIQVNQSRNEFEDHYNELCKYKNKFELAKNKIKS